MRQSDWKGFKARMCLAIPGRIIGFHDKLGVRMSRIDFGGVTREACMDYVPDAQVGEYVLVHVGFAISRVDEEEARRTYQYLEEMGELQDIYAGQSSQDGGGECDSPPPVGREGDT